VTMMSELPKFKTLIFPENKEEPLIEEFSFIELNVNVRIYFRPYDLGVKGFDFYVTSFHSVEYGENRPVSDYDDPSLRVECLFWGNVHWDGLKHLFMGDKATDNENYLYCIDTKLLSQIFIELRKLENTYCDNYQLGR